MRVLLALLAWVVFVGATPGTRSIIGGMMVAPIYTDSLASGASDTLTFTLDGADWAREDSTTAGEWWRRTLAMNFSFEGGEADTVDGLAETDSLVVTVEASYDEMNWLETVLQADLYTNTDPVNQVVKLTRHVPYLRILMTNNGVCSGVGTLTVGYPVE